jgi:hypothetical protein
MTTPTGLLAWGQAGNYNGIDDRLVLRALTELTPAPLFGVALPPTLSAGSGLTINIGAWNAIVDCGDGTSAVIGSRSATTCAETAGGASQRTDYIWADINPDGATWTINVITQAAASGRTGIQLGTVVVPAGAATAAAMTITPVASPWQWGGLAADQYGILRYTDAAGGVYPLGAQRRVLTAAQTVTNTFTVLASFPVQAGLGYEFDALFRMKQGGSMTAGNIGFAGPATVANSVVWFPWWYVNNSTTFNNPGVQGALGTVNVLGSVAAAGEADIRVTGMVQFSAPGTFQAGALASAGNNITAQPGCQFNLYPV